MQTIIFTGGGSAGHVTPNIALIEKCQQNGWKIAYIGSYHGIEKTLITRLGLPYYAISTGKLRRYFSWRTFIEPFAIIYGILQAYRLCHRLKPDIVFSKGGFVAFPVVLAAWLHRIPVMAHESDFSPGLANRLSFPFVKYICVTFKEAARYFNDQKKILVTGTPLRASLYQGNAQRGLTFCGFDTKKPVLFVYGGGLDAVKINSVVRDALPVLLSQFQIIHLCGQGKTTDMPGYVGYRQYDYLNEELPDLLASAEYVISRAGANSMYELFALCKPHILIPLPAKVSRGDQVLNARYGSEQGLSLVVEEETLTAELLVEQLHRLEKNKEEYLSRMRELSLPNSVELIYEQLCQLSRK